MDVISPAAASRTASRSRGLMAAIALVAIGALAGSQPAAAEVLYDGSRVSDEGLTGNSIANGNTSRNLAVGADGTIYAVFRGTNGIRVARSSNRGQTFAPSVVVSALDAEAEIAVSSTGIVYVVWADAGQAQISRSTNGGTTFSAPVTAGPTSGTVHMATDANMVYLLDQWGISFLRSADNGLTFTQVVPGAAQVFSDVHVDADTGDVFLQVDDPAVKYYVSTDQGATFGAMTTPNPGGPIYYSVGALSVGPAGRFLLVSGSGTDALRIDVDSNDSDLLTFGSNTVATARSLAADRCGNVVDGYVDGTDLLFHVSNDLGDTFGAPVTVAAVPDSADQNSNVFIDQTNGNVLFLYTQSGEVYLNVYRRELPCYEPQISVSTVVFSAQLLGTTSAAQVVHLTNSGAGAIQITGVAASGDFDFQTLCSGALAPGASCDISVTFTPTAAATRIGQIEISTDAFPQPRVVKLTGLGVATAPVAQFSPSPAEFGNRMVDTTGELTVTLSNIGNLGLEVDGFDVIGGFAFAADCPATLAPDESCDVVVSFSPDALTAYSGTLTLNSNAPGAPAAVALSGTGVRGFEVTGEVAGGEGTILPDSVVVMEGETQSFDVTPADGFVIASVAGCGGTLDGSTYTTAAITEACTITATFAVDEVVVAAHGKGGGGSMNLFTLGGLLLALLLRCVRGLRPGMLLLLMLPGLAQAGDFSRWYAGARIGSASTDVNAPELNSQLRDLDYDVVASIEDRSRTAWAVHGGFRWSRYLAAQLGYADLGTVRTEFNGSVVDVAEFLEDASHILPHSASGVELQLVGSYPLSDRLSITAQVGGFRWNADYKVRTDSGESARHEDDGTDLTFGAGIEFGLGARSALIAGWSRREVDSESIDLIALGFQYRWH